MCMVNVTDSLCSVEHNSCHSVIRIVIHCVVFLKEIVVVSYFTESANNNNNNLYTAKYQTSVLMRCNVIYIYI